jgi:hypothetical protein
MTYDPLSAAARPSGKPWNRRCCIISVVLVVIVGVISMKFVFTGQFMETPMPTSAPTVEPTLISEAPPTVAPTWFKGRRGTFLVLGDWGWDGKVHAGELPSSSCQTAIADAMHAKFTELEDVKFIINVGDSFYPDGVASKADPQWDSKWRQIYSKELRSVPWYSVYGNHDLHHDPCSCSDGPEDCAQVNKDITNLDFFYMPSYTWFLEHPELGIEIIAMDLNHYIWGWKGAQASGFMYECGEEILPHPLGKDHQCGPEKCRAVQEQRAKQSIDLLNRRLWQSKQPSKLVFSHYPTDYLKPAPGLLEALSTAQPDGTLTYFAGHRHQTDNTSTVPTGPNQNWVVGGGGGWGCDGQGQGFIVGEIQIDSSVITYPVLVDSTECCTVRYGKKVPPSDA